MTQFLLKKTRLIILFCLTAASTIYAQSPGLIISEFLANPLSTDSPYEFVELKATKFINFATTPYSIIVCNNGTATSAGWVAGGALSYGFSINTGTVNAGDVVYVGGTLMSPTGTKLRVINTGTTNGDGYGTALAAGVFGNGGANADGIAVFAADISTITNSTVPVDAVFYGTAVGGATVAVGGYQLPVNDLYSGGKVSTSSFIGPDPASGNYVIASGLFDTALNGFATSRTWTTSTTLTDGVSSVSLTTSVPPANLVFSTDNQTVLESIGTVTANISITSSNTFSSSVEVVIIPFGTATVGSDLIYTTQTVIFPASSTGARSQTITINDDALPEASEYFVIKLQNPVNANLSGIKEQIIFIKDNENSSPIATNEVSMTHVSSLSNGAFATNSAEIVAHDPVSQRIFVANSIGRKLDIIDFSNPTTMSLTTSIDISIYGNINSVAVKNGIVACAIENSTPELDGFVVFFNTSGVFQKQVTVGTLPDMITFNHAGTKVLTANEGQPNANYTIDPEGSVSIIDISGGIPSLSQSNVTTALFTAFNSQMASLKASGVRVFGPGSTVAQDMEPEYITVSEDDLTAYIALQENNAFAYVNLTTNTITDIKPLGFKDHMLTNNGLDGTSSGSNINIAAWPIKGMYMPDGMTHFNVGGVEYLITSNEGDSRQYGAFDEESTVGAATYSLDPVAFPYASIMKTNAAIGKLKCTNKLGDTDNDGDFDEIYTFGGRSFSIWNATTGTLVYDSGDDLEQIIAKDPIYGAIFNASHDDLVFKKRSSSKGPEPEGVAVATIAGNIYAFVSMERIGGLMMFNINNPAAPQFVQYVNNRGVATLTGDRGPEGIIYIKQQDSPSGKALIVLGNEVSSTISVYEIACPASTATIVSVGATTACSGSTIAINTSTISGASYTWYNGTTLISGATSATYNATVAGNYSVKLNNVGCAIPSNSLTLVFNALPSVSVAASSMSVCEGQTVTLNSSGAQTYSITNGVTDGAAFTPTTTATYTVTGSDMNSCENIAVITVTVNSIPTLSISAISAILCEGETTTITASGANTYAWTSGPTTATYSVTPSSSTTYSVIGTDVTGCSNTMDMLITVNALPTLTINASNSTICLGETTTLTSSGASTYTWTGGSTATNYSVTPTANTTYSIVGTDANGCSDSETIMITVNNLPTVTTTISSTLICSGETATLTAGGANTYAWTNGINTGINEVTPISNTTYTVIGTDLNNCSSSSVVSVSVNITPTITASTTNSTICSGETTTLTATGATSYTWSTGSNSISYIATPTISTTYSLIGEDNGCSATSLVLVDVNPLPIVSTSTSHTLICVGEAAILTANSTGSTFVWSNGVLTTSTSVSPTVTTVYTVTANDGLCNSSSTLTQSVSLCTSIIEIDNNNSISVYPNPFNTSFDVKWNNTSTETIIMVYNTLGELIYSDKTTDNKINVNTTNWKNGAYFIKVNNRVYKIIKQE